MVEVRQQTLACIAVVKVPAGNNWSWIIVEKEKKEEREKRKEEKGRRKEKKRRMKYNPHLINKANKKS